MTLSWGPYPSPPKSPLKLESGSFIEGNLRQYFSDVLYSLDTVEGEGYVHVFSGGLSVNTFSKDDLRGNTIDSLPEPTKAYLTPKAKPIISDWLQNNAHGYQYKNDLNIAAAQWLLVYQDLSTDNSNYELRYTVKFYKKPEDANMFSAFIISECSPKPETASLVDWQANGYALVKKTTEKYMDSCLLELNNQLPRLLKH